MWLFYILVGVIITRFYYAALYDVVEEPKTEETEVPTKIAYIEKIEEGKFFVYDKTTHQYLCKFVSWKQLTEKLNDIDEKVNWIVEHCYPEIDRKTLGE